MSTSIKIQVEREAILYQVKLSSYHIGDVRKDDKTMDLAAKVQASDDDDDLLIKFSDSGAAKVLDVLSSVLSETTLEITEVVKEEVPCSTYEYTLDVVSSFDANQKKGILEGVTDYIINWTLFEWLSIVYPESAKINFDKCELIRSDLRSRINARTRPVRRRYNIL